MHGDLSVTIFKKRNTVLISLKPELSHKRVFRERNIRKDLSQAENLKVAITKLLCFDVR